MPLGARRCAAVVAARNLLSARAQGAPLRLPSDLDCLQVDELDDLDRHRLEALARLEKVAADVFDLLRNDLAVERPSTADLERPRIAALVEDNIYRLFQIDDCAACALLVDHRTTISVDTVISELKGCDNRWRHEYLKRLFNKDEVAGQDYHMQMVSLFAEYEPKGLLAFLKASERYPLEAALGVCQQRGLLEEQAYLLGRNGRVAEALTILLERMGDVRRAVLFATEYQDPELWNLLVRYVLDHPHLLVSLLDHLEELGTLSEVGNDSGRPQPPPTAMPENVLRRLPPGTPV
eukprot:CAMPEP_0117623624 /NCGR_PEP_ID=MMETSP0784-20121206/88741_1 /TAXON_ID=39447 /ORGANISM="" /LENGTH=292 /DNA_ID=CAMNT_0005427577 /DNA_START=1 /DNA_END=878 /DNA_ORIENTATION=-